MVERTQTYTMQLPSDFSDDDAVFAEELTRENSAFQFEVFGLTVSRDGLLITVTCSPQAPETGDDWSDDEIIEMHQKVTAEIDALMQHFCS